MTQSIRYTFGVVKEALRRFDNDDQLSYAGHLAFTLLLSFGPFIVCLILAAEALVPNSVDSLKGMIEAMRQGMLVPDNMADVLLNVVDAVAKDDPTKSDNTLLLIVSGLVGLWAGSNAFESARKGFNEAYDVRDERKLPAKRFQTLFLAAVMATLFILMTISIVLTTIGLGVVGVADGEESQGIAFALVPALLGAPLFLVLLVGIHLTLPRGYAKNWSLYLWAQDETWDARPLRVRVLPGVIVSAVLWLIGAIGFSIALSTILSLEGKHGGLAGVVATLLFFYMSSAIIFLGAQVNIAIATLDADGKPVWPHPQTFRPEGYDPLGDPAYQVLTADHPEGSLARFWYYLCGGGVCSEPEPAGPKGQDPGGPAEKPRPTPAQGETVDGGTA
ncbi:MAG: YhjD/YihY/BrkB family envelope integrity protein [Pseudomonadota bacterium]